MKQTNIALFLGVILLLGTINSSALSFGSDPLQPEVVSWNFYNNSWSTIDTDGDTYNDQIYYEFWVDAYIDSNLTVKFELFDVSNTSVYSNNQTFFMYNGDSQFYSDSYVSSVNDSFYLEVTAWDDYGQVFFDKTTVFALWNPTGSMAFNTNAYGIETGSDGYSDTIFAEATLSWNNYNIAQVYNFSIVFMVRDINTNLIYTNTSWYAPTFSTDSFYSNIYYLVPFNGNFTVEIKAYENAVTQLYNPAYFVPNLIQEGGQGLIVNPNYYTYTMSTPDDSFYVNFEYNYNFLANTSVETFANFYYFDTSNGSYVNLNSYYWSYSLVGTGYKYDFLDWTTTVYGDLWADVYYNVNGSYYDGFSYYWTTGSNDLVLNYDAFAYDSDGNTMNDSIQVNLNFTWNANFSDYVDGYITLSRLDSNNITYFINSTYFNFNTDSSLVKNFVMNFLVPYSGDYQIEIYYYTTTWNSPTYYAFFYGLEGSSPYSGWDYTVDDWASDDDTQFGNDTLNWEVEFNNYNSTEINGDLFIEVRAYDPNGGWTVVFSDYQNFSIYGYSNFFYWNYYNAESTGDYSFAINGTVNGDMYSYQSQTYYLEKYESGKDYVDNYYNVTEGDWDNNGNSDFISINSIFQWDVSSPTDVESKAVVYFIDMNGNWVKMEEYVFAFTAYGRDSKEFSATYFVDNYGNYTVEYEFKVSGNLQESNQFDFFFLETYTGPIIWYAHDISLSDDDGDGSTDSIYFWVEYNYENINVDLFGEFKLLKMVGGVWQEVARTTSTVSLNGTGTGTFNDFFHIPSNGQYAVQFSVSTPTGFNFNHFQEFGQLSEFNPSASTSGTTTSDGTTNGNNTSSDAPPTLPVPFPIEFFALGLLVAIPVIRRKRV